MRLPETERLHTNAVEELKRLGDGCGRDGFGALLDAARFMAISQVCAAVRKDLQALTNERTEKIIPAKDKTDAA